MNKISGFTLIELLLVLVLVGVGSGLAIVSVDKLAGRVDERRWLDRTQQELRRLRNRAVLGGLPISAIVRFDEGTISTSSAPPLKLPDGYRLYAPEERQSPGISGPAKQVGLLFFPDGTMQEAHFGVITPSAMREEFYLERVTGRIERRNVVSPQ